MSSSTKSRLMWLLPCTRHLRETAGNQVAKELQESWDVWKTNRSLVGFPEDALTSPEVFKTYLKKRMGEEWSEVSWQYNRMMAEVEAFENAVLNYHVGDDMKVAFTPRVPEAQLSDGMKTWLRNNENMLNNYEASLRALDGWKKHLQDMSNGVNPITDLVKANKDELLTWAQGASKDKATMIDLSPKPLGIW